MIKKMWKKIVIALALVAGLTAMQANADQILLEDGNASTLIFAGEGSAVEDDGMMNWEVDGQNHLQFQWFFGSTAGDDVEIPLNALSYLGSTVNDTNGILGDPRDDKAVVGYELPDTLRVEVEYELTGGSDGSGKSTINESLRLTNLTDDPIDMTFYQYADFDLFNIATGNEASEDDVVEIINGNTVRQTDGAIAIQESVITPAAGGWEAALFSDTLDKLTDADLDNLNDNAGPVGPGDVTWAFQWNISLAPIGESGNTFLISKIKSLETAIPEPASLLLFGLGGLCMVRRRRA